MSVFNCFFGIVLLGGSAAATGGTATRPAQAPPNVLLIISDDQGWTDFGFMGSTAVRTPSLDRLTAWFARVSGS